MLPLLMILLQQIVTGGKADVLIPISDISYDIVFVYLYSEKCSDITKTTLQQRDVHLSAEQSEEQQCQPCEASSKLTVET